MSCSNNILRVLKHLFYGFWSSSCVKIKILLGTVWVAILRQEINLFPIHFRPQGKANLKLHVHTPGKKDKFHPITCHEGTERK